jgi:hypothetical protein
VNTSGNVMNRPPSSGQHQITKTAHHRQHLQRVHDAFGHLRRHELIDFPSEVVERFDAKRQAHAIERPEHIAGNRHAEPGGRLEQQCRAASRHLRRPVGHSCDLEVRRDRLLDANEELSLV